MFVIVQETTNIKYDRKNKEERAVISILEKELTITNPQYINKQKLNLPNYGIQKNLTYMWHLGSSEVSIPVGYTQRLLELTKMANIKPVFADARAEGIDLAKETLGKYKFTGTLRKYQHDAMISIGDRTMGVVQAMTGSGKTLVMVNMLTQRKVATLVVVNRIELAQQFIAQIKKFTNIPDEHIGLMAEGKCEFRPISIATFQTLHRFDKKTINACNKFFGQVIVDEVHIVSATTYFDVMNTLKTKYKFGFSATLKRDDGLSDLINWATGPKIHEVPLDELDDVLLYPTYKSINTDYYYPLTTTTDYQDMITDLSEDEERNDLIIEELNFYPKEQTVLLCSRIVQCLLLHEKIPGSDVLIAPIPKATKERLAKSLGDVRVDVLKSKASKIHRKKVIDRLRKGDLRIIISTYGLFSTGLDVPTLEVGLLCAPIKSTIKIRQSAGRLMRKAATVDKHPIIIDFVDRRIDLLRGQAVRRSKILKNLKGTD